MFSEGMRAEYMTFLTYLQYLLEVLPDFFKVLPPCGQTATV